MLTHTGFTLRHYHHKSPHNSGPSQAPSLHRRLLKFVFSSDLHCSHFRSRSVNGRQASAKNTAESSSPRASGSTHSPLDSHGLLADFAFSDKLQRISFIPIASSPFTTRVVEVRHFHLEHSAL
ncbi:hypothetical protein VTI28DRAFT_6412 [Corynascus sepedonium]